MNYKKIFSKRGIKVIYSAIKYIFMYFVVKLENIINKEEKDIWLISERSSEARDNGYHMFKYIREMHSEVDVYYAIDKKSKDRSKIDYLGNVIEFGSLKHYRIYFKASRHISTHINGYMPNEKADFILNKYLKVNAKKVFLQHGVIKDFMPQCCKDKTGLDLFVCGAYPEYKFIKENFGYEDEVKYLGLPRFDNLRDSNIKRQILLMPTFRMDLFSYADDKISDTKEKYFLESEYYKKYQSLINNHDLIDILNNNDIDLVFYPHFEIQRYIHLFSTSNHKVKIATKEDYDVQELLKESRLLITDYSSVYFDFAYMKKPVLYYHFDYDKYRSIHYKEGYFSYEGNGFGKVVKTEEDLIKEIIKIVDNDFYIEDFYSDRISEFFKLDDDKNRMRVFEAIRDLD